MFGGHFYPERIRKAVAVFGSLFNNLNVIRKSAAGEVLSQVKVPLSYSPKRDFLSRLDGMSNGEEGERQIAVKLPRMSFEIVSMNYDPSRQLPKMNHCIKPSSTVDGAASKLYTPVPYLIQFQLNIYSKSQDDGLQIVEQVVPFFTPHYTLTVKPLADYENVKEDSQITLQGITFSDDYEASLESRRTIIYTLDFDMKVNLYKDASAVSPLITQYEIDVLDLSGNELFPASPIADSALQASPLTGTTDAEVSYSVSNFQIVNSHPTSYGLRIGSDPSNGTASITYTDTLTSVSGVVVTSGSWTYTPNVGFVGVDTFGIELLYGDSDSYSYNIDMTIDAVIPEDPFVSLLSNPLEFEVSTINSPETLDVSTNDSYTDPVYAINSQPAQGVATINASTGVITYTAATFDETSLVYSVTRTGGTAQLCTVNIIIAF